MDIASQDWKAWAKEPFPSPAPGYVCEYTLGSSQEPDSSRWCASLMNPVREQLQKPFVLLDWGCGDGRLFNFLAKRFRDFQYWGLERPGTFGEQCVRSANMAFGCDARAHFGLYDGSIADEAISKAEIAVMGSIATHIPFETFEGILLKLMPIMGRGGKLISSFFIEPVYELRIPNVYGHEDCWGYVSYTKTQIDDVCRALHWKANQRETYGIGNLTHKIFVFEKA